MSAAWITLPDLAELEDYLVAAQLAAMNSAALGDAQSDRFTAARDTVVERIRRHIESGRQVLSATAASIPPELHWVACYLIIALLQPAIKLALTDDQKRQIDSAESELRKILKGELKVTAPDDPQSAPTAQSGGSIEVVSAPERRFSREKLDGL